MVASTSLDSYDRFAKRYEGKKTFNNSTFAHIFRLDFGNTRELTYDQRLQMVNRVIQHLSPNQENLTQTVIQIAEESGISVGAAASDETITHYLHGIIESLEKTSSPPNKELAKLVPFVFELIRQNKINNVLDCIWETFAKCSIPLQLDSLKNALENGIDSFAVELSTQLCQNDQFVNDNIIEAVKYCFPRVKEELVISHKDRISACFFTRSFEKTEALFIELFKTHFKLFIDKLVECRSSKTFPDRIAFAKAVLNVDLNYLVQRFLYLFSEEEIFNHDDCSELLKEVKIRLSNKNDPGLGIFTLICVYLNRWSENVQTRTSASGLMRSMFKEQSAGKSSSSDNDLPRDTPVWREICSLSDSEGTDHLFKLDWDFDLTNMRTDYVKQHSEEIKKQGYTSDLMRLLFPALIFSLPNKQLVSWWAPLLGYSIRGEHSGTYMTLPEPAAIMNRWKKVIANPQAVGVYQGFSIAETEGSSSVGEFIDLFKKHDVVCSKTTEFVHDHQFHILNTIQAIMNSTAEEYLEPLKAAREYVSKAQRRIEKAWNNSERPVDETMFKVLEYSLGIFVDVFTTNQDLKGRKKDILDVFLGKQIYKYWYGKQGILWRRAFKKYNIDPNLYDASRIQEYWDRIVKNDDINLRLISTLVAT